MQRRSSQDQVAVSHQGRTHLYDCPGDLHAAVMVACSAELEQAERTFARVQLRRFKRRLRRRQATRRASWRRLQRDMAWLSLVAAMLGALGGLALGVAELFGRGVL